MAGNFCTDDSKSELIDNIIKYMNILEKRYGVKINFSSVNHIFEINSAFYNKIFKYTYHENPLCNYIKHNKMAFSRCLDCKRLIRERLIRAPAWFCGMCHAGICEYVFPIMHKGVLAAYICVGEFNRGKRSISNLDRTAMHCGLDSETLRRLFCETVDMRMGIEDEESFICDVLSLCYMFSYLYTMLADKHSALSVKNPIINSALTYIEKYYTDRITLNDIAAYCHCNKNYLCSLFREVMDISVIDYINEIRIKHAMIKMRISGANVTEIALNCGFSSPAYFATVFRQIAGMSPREYMLNILNV